MIRLGLVLCSIACAAVSACSQAGLSCTQVGGVEGVSVTVPGDPLVREGSIILEVCDSAGCASATRNFGPLGGRPSGFGEIFTLDDLGRASPPGSASTTVTLAGQAGSVLAATRNDVAFRRSYPNGPACDGDGFVSAAVELTRSDRSDVDR